MSWNLAGALGGDELLQPADLPLGGLEAVSLELERVGVEPLGGPTQHVPQSLATLLDAAPATLQDPQPGLLIRSGEEREVDAEPGIVVRLGSSLGEQLLEPLLALRRDLVDDPATLARHG